MQPQVTANRENGPAELRKELVKEYPEIKWLCSDRYLSDVLSVKSRTFEYACNEKVRKSLQWRREFRVDRICDRFRYNARANLFELQPAIAKPDPQDIFQPSQALLSLCQSGALSILPSRSQAGHVVLHVETQLIDWQAVGVEAGMQYHVLVIETALNIIRSERGGSPESMVLLVDTTAPLFAKPPPVGALQGLVALLQRAYPDRIHQICVGPVNFVVRGLYNVVSHFMSKNSQHKIKLISKRPKEGYLLDSSSCDQIPYRTPAARDIGPVAPAGHCAEVQQCDIRQRTQGYQSAKYGKHVADTIAHDDEASTNDSDGSLCKDDSSSSAVDPSDAVKTFSHMEEDTGGEVESIVGRTECAKERATEEIMQRSILKWFAPLGPKMHEVEASHSFLLQSCCEPKRQVS